MFFLFLYTYLKQTVQYDLINTFHFNNFKQIPKVQIIVLNFGYQKSNFKRLISGLLALEFITSKKGEITRSKHLNILLKIKQGSPVGCKITLKKKIMYRFYLKLTTSIFPKLSIPKNTHFKQNYKSLSVVIQNPLIFMELENHYEFFKDIPKLDITFITDSKSKNELSFLLKSIKIFL
jgi:large subunit ribosomal protein L5